MRLSLDNDKTVNFVHQITCWLRRKSAETVCSGTAGNGSSPERGSLGCQKPLCPAKIFALAHLPCGVCALVRALDVAPEAAERLRRLGLREGTQLQLVNADPVLVSIDNNRIALGAALAERIQVESI